MRRILVTGAGGPAAHNFIESLRISKREYYIVGTDINKYHIELSIADKKYLIVPASDRSYISRLNEIIDIEGIELVHPQPDPEVKVLSENRHLLKAKTFLPAHETIEICQDKLKLNGVLKNAEVPVPYTKRITPDNAHDVISEILELGGDRVWIRAIRGAGSRASLPIKKAEHARMWMEYWIEMKGLTKNDFMISEFLPGREYAFQSVWKDGELIVSQARERMEYLFGNITPSGQTSTPSVARTVNRDDVNEIATKAVLAVDSHATGVFCVDMKENREGVPCITEINAGRFFTTSNFFSYAGVNMPDIYVRLALNEDIPRMKKYNPLPPGIYWIRHVDCGYKMVKEGKWSWIDFTGKK